MACSVRARQGMGARTVRELAVWQLCEELRLAVIAATATGSAARNVRFCDQIRDATVDAVSDVAEGFARFQPKDFARFLDYALASLGEVQTRARDAHGRGYFDDRTASAILRLAARAEAVRRGFVHGVQREFDEGSTGSTGSRGSRGSTGFNGVRRGSRRGRTLLPDRPRTAAERCHEPSFEPSSEPLSNLVTNSRRTPVELTHEPSFPRSIARPARSPATARRQASDRCR